MYLRQVKEGDASVFVSRRLVNVLMEITAVSLMSGSKVRGMAINRNIVMRTSVIRVRIFLNPCTKRSKDDL